MQESPDQNLPTQETEVFLYPCGMKTFRKIVVASTIFYGVVCWGSSTG